MDLSQVLMLLLFLSVREYSGLGTVGDHISRFQTYPPSMTLDAIALFPKRMTSPNPESSSGLEIASDGMGMPPNASTFFSFS